MLLYWKIIEIQIEKLKSQKLLIINPIYFIFSFISKTYTNIMNVLYFYARILRYSFYIPDKK